jgi:hypothetical protein
MEDSGTTNLAQMVKAFFLFFKKVLQPGKPTQSTTNYQYKPQTPTNFGKSTKRTLKYFDFSLS